MAVADGPINARLDSPGSGENSPAAGTITPLDQQEMPGERLPSSIARRHRDAEDPIELLKKKLGAASYVSAC